MSVRRRPRGLAHSGLRYMRLVCYGMLMLAACARSRKDAPSAGAPLPESAVYAVLLDSVIHYPSDTVVVLDSTAVLPSGLVQLRVGTRIDSMPPTLPAALDRLTGSRQATARLPFPRPVDLVSNTMLREMFSRGITGGWSEFHLRYPRTGYLKVSPVALSADTLDALVYYEFRCGGMCGQAEFVWITRRGASHWHVRKIFQFLAF